MLARMLVVNCTFLAIELAQRVWNWQFAVLNQVSRDGQLFERTRFDFQRAAAISFCHQRDVG